MTTPARPPGLPFFSRLVLSSPPLVHHILFHLVRDSLVQSQNHPEPRPARYTELCGLSLVNKAWAESARCLLFDFVWLGGGTKQLKQWIYAVDQPAKRGEEAPSSKEVVVVCPGPPVKLDDVDDEERRKNDRAVITEAFSRMRGVGKLLFGLFNERDMPASLLEGEGFKDLKELILACPLSGHFKLTCRLSALMLVDWSRERSWSPTLSHLAPSLTQLTDLNLVDFTSSAFEEFLFPHFVPCAANLRRLQLPHLRLNSSSWRLALFAVLCKSLTYLGIARGADARAIYELVPLFLRTSPHLQTLEIDDLAVPLGAGLVESRYLAFEDPIVVLVNLVNYFAGTIEEGGEERRRTALAEVIVHDVQAKGPSRGYVLQTLTGVAQRRGVTLRVSLAMGAEWEDLTKDEEMTLTFLERQQAAFVQHQVDQVTAQLAAMEERKKRGEDTGPVIINMS
ncbi:hypothetical protein JCM8097_006651 [Rhodosporidiobolus ruineniae]